MAPEKRSDLLSRIRDLEGRLEEAEETLRALRSGEVDAIVMHGPEGEQVYTLKGAEQPYRIMLEGMAEGALTASLDGLILFSNEQFARIVGTPLERAIGAHIHDFVTPEDAPLLAALLGGANGRKAELRLKTPEGTLVPVYVSVDNLVMDETECLCLLVTDLTEQKRNEEIMAAERLALSILDQAAEAILVADPEGRINRASRAADGLAGRPVLLRQFDELFEIGLRAGREWLFRDILAAAREKGAIRGVEGKVRTPDGRERDVLLSAAVLSGAGSAALGCVVTLTDITERRHREERLQQAQKLESIGVLAGGMAHDFNNLLVGVIGSASLALETLPKSHPATELIEGVIRAGEHLATLTRQMLAYSGKGRLTVERLNLSELVPEISLLIQPSISKKIALHFDLGPDLPAIEADRGQMHQVLMNLILNAAEAIGREPGVVSVRTGVQDVDEPFLKGHPEAAELKPGKYVCLEVRDTGCGMDGSTMARVFDPFFSTKFTGRGLGLAAVSGIVRSHIGLISVTSKVGHGSCFCVLLPAAGDAKEEHRQETHSEAASGPAGTVLVVDDEKLVRDMVKHSLAKHGFKVLLADSGDEALGIVKRHPGNIDLVLLDQGMPDTSGENLLPELRKIRPGIAVAVSSGYAEGDTLRLFKGQRVSGFIPKPYTSAGLVDKVKALLRSERAESSAGG